MAEKAEHREEYRYTSTQKTYIHTILTRKHIFTTWSSKFRPLRHTCRHPGCLSLPRAEIARAGNNRTLSFNFIHYVSNSVSSSPPYTLASPTTMLSSPWRTLTASYAHTTCLRQARHTHVAEWRRSTQQRARARTQAQQVRSTTPWHVHGRIAGSPEGVSSPQKP